MHQFQFTCPAGADFSFSVVVKLLFLAGLIGKLYPKHGKNVVHKASLYRSAPVVIPVDDAQLPNGPIFQIADFPHAARFEIAAITTAIHDIRLHGILRNFSIRGELFIVYPPAHISHGSVFPASRACCKVPLNIVFDLESVEQFWSK